MCFVTKKKFESKNHCKAVTSSRMYSIFVILAILMTSSSDDVIKFSNFTIHLPSLCGATVNRVKYRQKKTDSITDESNYYEQSQVKIQYPK